MSKESWDQPLPRYVSTLLLMALQFLIACVLESLSKVLILIGCTSGILISFVLPSLMFLEHLRRVETCDDRSGHRSLLHSFGNLSVIADPNDDADSCCAPPASRSTPLSVGDGTRQVKSGHSQSTFWIRRGPAWLLIGIATVAGLSSLADLIFNWNSA